MSSILVRQEIEDFIVAEFPSEQLCDLSADFAEINDLLKNFGYQPGTPWLGITYLGGDEIPVDIRANHTVGKYRETGVIQLHVVERAQLSVVKKILPRGEALRNGFRGRRIGKTLIRSISTVQFGQGATISFNGGYQAGLIEMTYERDIDL